jgi:hypothetical protein
MDKAYKTLEKTIKKFQSSIDAGCSIDGSISNLLTSLLNKLTPPEVQVSVKFSIKDGELSISGDEWEDGEIGAFFGESVSFPSNVNPSVRLDQQKNKLETIEKALNSSIGEECQYMGEFTSQIDTEYSLIDGESCIEYDNATQEFIVKDAEKTLGIYSLEFDVIRDDNEQIDCFKLVSWEKIS